MAKTHSFAVTGPAKAVLPYLHPQLSATTIDARLTDDLSQRSTEDLQRELDQIESRRRLVVDAHVVETAMTLDVEALEAPWDEPEAAD